VTVASENDSATQSVTVQEPASFTVDILSTTAPVTEGDTLQVTANVTNAGDVQATQTITLTDTGFADSQRDAVDVTLAGGASNESVVLEWTTSQGDAGTGDVTIASENDSATQSVTVQEPAEFTVDVISTTAPVTEGDTLEVTANVTNIGDAQATQTITLTDTGFADSQQDTVDVTLAAGASNESVVLEWTTSDGDAGSGDVTVASEDDTDTEPVTVQEPASFAVTITDTTSPVTEGDVLTVTANVTNTGDAQATRTITLNDTGFDGVERDAVDVTLAGGESNGSVALEWATSPGDAGSGDLTVASENDTDSTSVTVQEPAAFAVEVIDITSPVIEGDSLTVTANVTNTGDTQATQTITLEDTGFSGTEQDTVDITLAGGASNESVTLEWTTSAGDAGSGQVTVASENDTDTETVTVIEGASFEVDLDVPAEPVLRGEVVDLEAEVANTGGVAGTTDVAIEVDGRTVESEEVSLSGGAETTVATTWDTSHVVLPADDEPSDRGRSRGDDGAAQSTDLAVTVEVEGAVTEDAVTVECIDQRNRSRGDPEEAVCGSNGDEGRDRGATVGGVTAVGVGSSDPGRPVAARIRTAV